MPLLYMNDQTESLRALQEMMREKKKRWSAAREEQQRDEALATMQSWMGMNAAPQPGPPLAQPEGTDFGAWGGDDGNTWLPNLDTLEVQKPSAAGIGMDPSVAATAVNTKTASEMAPQTGNEGLAPKGGGSTTAPAPLPTPGEVNTPVTAKREQDAAEKDLSSEVGRKPGGTERVGPSTGVNKPGYATGAPAEEASEANAESAPGSKTPEATKALKAKTNEKKKAKDAKKKEINKGGFGGFF